jgi:hypothetical protein
MLSIRGQVIFAVLAFALAGLAGAAAALPGPVSCLLIGTFQLKTLPDGSLSDSESQADHLRVQALTQQAKQRIETLIGPLKAKLSLCCREICGESLVGHDEA